MSAIALFLHTGAQREGKRERERGGQSASFRGAHSQLRVIGKEELPESRGAETCLSLTWASKMLAGLWVSDAEVSCVKHPQKWACIPGVAA